jgi:restriction system protein
MSDNDQQAKIRPSGGYRCLRSFQVATLIYDATVSFTERFVDKRSRLVDQMVQAARSGRQNIAEGSRASATSSQTELRLVNVARASLDELLLDYEDFLRQRGMSQWAKDAAEALKVRAVSRALQRVDRSDRTDPTDPPDEEHRRAYARWLTNRDPAVVANAVICLIHQANYLLDQQIAGLERSFISEGGYSERLAAARLAARGQTHIGAAGGGPAAVGTEGQRGRCTPWPRRVTRDEHGQPFPQCPRCGKPLVLRTAHQGRNAGAQFLGCSTYPACKGTLEL